MPDTRLDEVCINAVRFLAADAVQKANSGHPGTPMGAAPTAYVLWDRFLEARFTGEGRHRRRLEKVLAMERKVLHQQTHAQEGEDDC